MTAEVLKVQAQEYNEGPNAKINSPVTHGHQRNAAGAFLGVKRGTKTYAKHITGSKSGCNEEFQNNKNGLQQRTK